MFIIQIIQQDLAQQEPVLERVVRNGSDQVKELEHGKEQDDLRNKLSEAEAKWKSLKQRYDDDSRDIEQLYPFSQKYDDDAVTFSIWLERTEKRKADLENQPLLPNESDLKKQRKDSEVCNYFCSHRAFLANFIKLLVID